MKMIYISSILACCLLAVGTLETLDQRDKYNYCIGSGPVLFTDSQIIERVRECEGWTGYKAPVNELP